MTYTTAFCPGHISCVFQPFTSLNLSGAGSRGIGIRLSLGAMATVSLRTDGEVNVSLDGEPHEAPVTRGVASKLAPGVGFDISIDNDLPVSQGFGMSAAGALATAVCIADLTGRSRAEALIAAHEAEIIGGGGLGDIPALVAGMDVPIREVPGIPPYGKVINAKFTFPKLTLAILGDKMPTGSVLSDPEVVGRIRTASSRAMAHFSERQTPHGLFEASNMFSADAGLESQDMTKVLKGLWSKGYGAGMCMLGNSIFTDAPEDVIWKMLGRGHVWTFECASSHQEIRIIRRG